MGGDTLHGCLGGASKSAHTLTRTVADFQELFLRNAGEEKSDN